MGGEDKVVDVNVRLQSNNMSLNGAAYSDGTS